MLAPYSQYFHSDMVIFWFQRRNGRSLKRKKPIVVEKGAKYISNASRRHPPFALNKSQSNSPASSREYCLCNKYSAHSHIQTYTHTKLQSLNPRFKTDTELEREPISGGKACTRLDRGVEFSFGGCVANEFDILQPCTSRFVSSVACACGRSKKRQPPEIRIPLQPWLRWMMMMMMMMRQRIFKHRTETEIRFGSVTQGETPARNQVCVLLPIFNTFFKPTIVTVFFKQSHIPTRSYYIRLL